MHSLWDIWQLWNLTCFLLGLPNRHIWWCVLKEIKGLSLTHISYYLAKSRYKLMKAPFFWQDGKSIFAEWQIYFDVMGNLRPCQPLFGLPPPPDFSPAAAWHRNGSTRLNTIDFYPFTRFCQWFFWHQQLTEFCKIIETYIHSLKVCPDQAPLSIHNLKWWPFLRDEQTMLKDLVRQRVYPIKWKQQDFQDDPLMLLINWICGLQLAATFWHHLLILASAAIRPEKWVLSPEVAAQWPIFAPRISIFAPYCGLPYLKNSLSAIDKTRVRNCPVITIPSSSFVFLYF